MSVVITREDLIAYAEVDYIIKHMNEKYILKLPKNLLEFFDTMKDTEHQTQIDPHKPLQEQGLQKYALEIIALLHIKYWCEDETRKEELLERMRENQEKFETQLREKFSTENLFSTSTKEDNNKIGKDPVITAYSSYMQTNPDIQDYTDLRETPIETEELPETLEEKSLFQKIKLFVSKIFKKTA